MAQSDQSKNDGEIGETIRGQSLAEEHKSEQEGSRKRAGNHLLEMIGNTDCCQSADTATNIWRDNSPKRKGY